MRISEWIQTLFPLVLTAAAWLTGLTSQPLPLQRRWTVTYLAIAALALVALGRFIASLLSTDSGLIVRDGFTVALFLIPYWQTGQFFLKPNLKTQERLLAFDRWLLPRTAAESGTARSFVGFALEVSYLFCYPLVPLGLAVVYLAGLRGHIDSFWFVLLVSTYICYAVTPFVPAYPPRSVIADETAAPAAPKAETNKGRVFNRWILQHGSIHAISFPSAHVASAFAIALVLLRYAWPIGVVFLVIAVMISLGAVIGRYHYALDVLMGAITSLAVFFVSYRWL